MMSKIVFFLACMACVQVGRADISYQTTLKQGPAAGATTQFKIKGLKVRIEGREGITLVDLGARTITVLRPVDKTYTVRAIEEGAVGVKKSPGALRTAVKETGVTRKIGNYRCRQVVMTMTMAGGPLSLTMENEMWVSRDVPGFEEWRAVTQKMADKAIAPVVVVFRIR